MTIADRLRLAGFVDYGLCNCAVSKRTFKRGKWSIKVYGNKQQLALFFNKTLMRYADASQIEEIIQQAV
jgi:hypothetical protein